MRNNKGITLISLTIMIIVLVILATMTMYYGNSIISEAKIQDLKTNMLLIEASVKGNLEQYNFEVQSIKPEDTAAIEELKGKYLIGKKILDNPEIQEKFNNLGVQQYGYEYYYLDTETLASLGLNDVQSDEESGYYIVGYTTDLDTSDEEYTSNIQVINTKGYQSNYTLDSIENI